MHRLLVWKEASAEWRRGTTGWERGGVCAACGGDGVVTAQTETQPAVAPADLLAKREEVAADTAREGSPTPVAKGPGLAEQACETRCVVLMRRPPEVVQL